MRFVFAASLLFLLAACSDDPRDTSPPRPNTDCGYGRHYVAKTADCMPDKR